MLPNKVYFIYLCQESRYISLFYIVGIQIDKIVECIHYVIMILLRSLLRLFIPSPPRLGVR